MSSYICPNEKKKILVLTNAYPNNLDENLGIDIKRQVEGISEDFEIKVVATIATYPFKRVIDKQPYNVAEKRQDGHIEVFYRRYLVIPKVGRGLFGFFCYFSLRQLMIELRKEFNFNAIISFWTYPEGYAAVLLGKKYNLPVIIRPRGSDINILPRGYIRKKIIQYTLNKCTTIFPVCGDLKNKIIKLGVEPHKIMTITLGVDTEIFNIQERQDCRKKLGINQNSFFILFAGYLRRIKGVEYLIKAIDILCKNSINNINLIIIGHGKLENKLKNMVKGYELSDRISFVGSIENTALPIWMNAADLFCLPSLSEGWPNVLMEALACGVPIVASNVGGIPEIVNDKKYGFLVDPKNPDQLAEAVKEAKSRQWNREDLRARVKNNSWQDCIDRLKAEIRKVVL
ncbi:MAG: glycosyltransferase [Candidatus Omnitrophota bacterium]